MDIRVLKNVIFLLDIVFFIFSLSACKTIKAGVSFKWSKIIECKHHLEAKKARKEYLLTSYTSSWIMSKQ